MLLDTVTTFALALIAFLLALLMPGAVWLLWARSSRWDGLEWLAEAAGSSLSITALVGIMLAWAGVSLNAFGVGALMGALLLVWITAKVWQGGRWRLRAKTLVMVGVILGLVAWRLYQARTLVLPAWVDSVHHTLLVRIILEQGGIPWDWAPYLPVPMFYHFGFHVSAALFSFFSRFEPAQTLLIYGQVLNALTAVAVYRLGKAIWGDSIRAGVAALLVGFVFQMPAYYVTWGRYTLLTGLAILPLAVAAALDIQRNRSNRYAWGRLALYSAGLCFCHFLVVGLLALFLLALVIVELIKAWKARDLRQFAWQPLAAAGIGLLMAAPWLWRVWSYSAGYFGVAVTDPFDVTQAESINGYLNYLSYLLGPWRGHFLLILAGLGLVLAFGRAKSVVLAVWAIFMAFLATPWAPRFNPFRPDHLAIVLFLPASLLAADVLVRAGEALGKAWRRWAGQVGLSVAVGSLLIWGVVDGRDILNPVTIFTTPADVAALRWIEQNTPPSARFFINSTPWQMGMYRGVDGGYWITPTTGRHTLVPPAAYGWGSGDDITSRNELIKRASQVKGCSEEFWSLVQADQLTHIYMRELAGTLQPGDLSACEGVEVVYAQEGVWVYHILEK